MPTLARTEELHSCRASIRLRKWRFTISANCTQSHYRGESWQFWKSWNYDRGQRWQRPTPLWGSRRWEKKQKKHQQQKSLKKYGFLWLLQSHFLAFLKYMNEMPNIVSANNPSDVIWPIIPLMSFEQVIWTSRTCYTKSGTSWFRVLHEIYYYVNKATLHHLKNQPSQNMFCLTDRSNENKLIFIHYYPLPAGV